MYGRQKMMLMSEEIAETTSTGSTATTTLETSSATSSNEVITPAVAEAVATTVQETKVEPVVPPVVETKNTDEVSALEELKNKKPDEAPAAPVIEDYEIEFSEKTPLTDKEMDGIVALAEKYKWTKEETQAHIEEKEQLYTRGFDKLRAQAMDIVKAEKEKLFADPDFKGAKLPESLALIDSAVEKYGSPELAKYLQGPGGNSLPLSKMLLKIGQLMAPENKMPGKGTANTNTDPNSLEASYRRQYPQFFE